MLIKYLRILCPVILLVAAASAALTFVSARAGSGHKPPDNKLSVETPASVELPEAPALNATQNNSATARVEALIITLRPAGFEPREITLPQGRYILAFNNRSGASDLTLRLDQESGNRLREVRLRPKKLSWREIIELHPGTYILSEADHPEWVCRITITSH